MQIETKMIGLSRQLCICALMCSTAVAVILLFHSRPYIPLLPSGLPVFQQVLLGVAFGGLFWAANAIGYKYTTKHPSTQRTVKSYRRLDLRGWNPLWIALAAGFGEEFLFRGALQPLLGVWFTSVLFVLAHTRAHRLNKFSKQMLLQALTIFVTGVVLGFIARYAGLWTAMIVHAAVDVVSLYTLRRMAYVPTPATA